MFGFFYLLFLKNKKPRKLRGFFYYASPVGPKLIGIGGCS